MSLDEPTLERVAQDGYMDYDKWPAIVEPMLDRINYITYHEFEIPRPYPIINQVRRPFPPSPKVDSRSSNPSAQDSTPSENGGPTISATPTPSRTLPPVPLFPSTATTETTPPTSQIADSLPPPTQTEAPVLPAPLLQLLNGIIKTINTSFTALPPHTVQRLAELILDPKRYYRTLPAWLRALDRTISVTSTADIFPLPKALPLPSHVIDSSLLTNGVHTTSDRDDESTGILGGGGGGLLWLNNADGDRSSETPDNDESLGGALLTPIPWLRNGVVPSREDDSSGTHSSGDAGSEDEHDDILAIPPGGSISSPSSASSRAAAGLPLVSASPNHLVPEREDGAVTQGELIRQEQEAGVVPVGHSDADSRGMMLDDDEEDEEDDEELEDGEERDNESEVPHARGPGMLGAVDIGRVGGRDVELNLGNRGDDANAGRRGIRDAQDVLIGGRTDGEGVEGREDAMQLDGGVIQHQSGPAGAHLSTTTAEPEYHDQVDSEASGIDQNGQRISVGVEASLEDSVMQGD